MMKLVTALKKKIGFLRGYSAIFSFDFVAVEVMFADEVMICKTKFSASSGQIYKPGFSLFSYI